MKFQFSAIKTLAHRACRDGQTHSQTVGRQKREHSGTYDPHDSGCFLITSIIAAHSKF